jgi:ribosomal protein S18 acetylase RimI-like enzyme
LENELNICLATLDDVPGLVALQEANLPTNGGNLSVRQPSEWFTNRISEDSVVIARCDGQVVGYVLGTSLVAQAHIPIIHALLSTYPAPPECYLYGPVCVAESMRGRGLAVALFEALQKHMGRRPAMTFVRTDNAPSRRTHQKMGMRELGPFLSQDIRYVALTYDV